MMPERLVSDVLAKPDAALELTLRPSLFSEFVGQANVKERLEIAVQAAKQRGEALDHLLFSGPPGLGKTTLAHIISKSMGAGLKCTSGPTIEKAGDLAGLLTNLEEGDVLFIDEIHRLQKTIEEYLYPAMEDFKLDIIIDQGPNARSVRLNLPHFTLVATATKTDGLSPLLVASFPLIARFENYATEEAIAIARKLSEDLGVRMDEAAIQYIGSIATGPGFASFLLELVRVHAQARESSERITPDLAMEALKALPSGQESGQRREAIPSEVKREVWRRDGGRCVKCGSRERLEYDHIIPVTKGGSNTARNIELLCEICNQAKSDLIQ